MLMTVGLEEGGFHRSWGFRAKSKNGGGGGMSFHHSALSGRGGGVARYQYPANDRYIGHGRRSAGIVAR